jgi:hypothetical protein
VLRIRKTLAGGCHATMTNQDERRKNKKETVPVTLFPGRSQEWVKVWTSDPISQSLGPVANDISEPTRTEKQGCSGR